MTDSTRRAALLCVSAVLIVLAVIPAIAQFVPTVCYLPDGKESAVTVNGQIAMRFKAPNGNLSTLDRARLTAQRLKPLASGAWKDIAVKAVGKRRAQLVVNDQIICMVTSADAKAAKKTASALAGDWAVNLRRLFSMPPITISQKEVVVPENETRTICVGGAASGVLKSTDGNPTIANSVVDSLHRTLTVKGKKVGKAVVEVTCQGCPAMLLVEVKRYAGKVSRAATAEVTGQPAPDWVLKEAAKRVASSSVDLEPGATAVYDEPKLASESLKQGETQRVMVPVKVDGSNLIATQLLVPVDVYNRQVSEKQPINLFYSNDPEQIKTYQTLFFGKLDIDEKSRLFFHHQSAISGRVRLSIELVNVGAVPASVQTISGVTTPVPDPVKAGYFAGVNFIKSYLRQGGIVHKIPARSRLCIYADYLGRVDTASGIIDLRQLEGDDVYVRVNAEPASSDLVSEGGWAPISDGYTPSQLSDEVFNEPLVRLDATYVVGEQWGFIRIGKNEIRDLAGDNTLFGNYGVIYEVNAHIENPTSDTRKIHVIFEPTAGPAAGVFVVGGQIVSTRTIMPPREFEIMALTVPPGKARDISLLTMPLGGSAYPAMIVIKP